MAVVRETDADTQLEYPRGKALYHTAGYIGNPRISPSGDQVAFLDHASPFDNAGDVAVIGRDGRKITLARGFTAAEGLAWSPRGDEIWFTAARAGARSDLRAVTLNGKERVIYSQSSSMLLHDIAKDGRVLIGDTRMRTKLMFHGPGESRERDLSWLDWSVACSISSDGKLVAFSETGDGAGAQGLAYLRETDGKPAVLLGPGGTVQLSPDSRFVVVVMEAGASTITIVPVGTGQSRSVPIPGYTADYAGLLPDGQHLWFNGSQPSHGRRLFRLNLADGAIVPISEEGIAANVVGVTPDGNGALTMLPGHLRLYWLDGRPPRDLPAIAVGERIAGLTADGAAMFVYDRTQLPAQVFRVDLATGRRELAFSIQPADRAGLESGIGSLFITPDGKAYTYSVSQVLSELHSVTGLK
jgi:dipeptidyl aminopeptidase/acylaminoacyl peptidase